MKSKEEIEQLASEHILSENGQIGFVLGYIQCKKDMADKKYTEEDMLNCWNTLMVAMTNKKTIFFNDYIKSLNKQYESKN
jgi:hypothetical protein